MRRIALVLVGFLALAAVIGVLATGGGSSNDNGGGAATGSTGGSTGAARSVGEGNELAAVAAPAPASDAGGGGQTAVAGIETLPNLPAQVIKTGQISLKLDKDGFEHAFDAASLVADRYGGYVQSSSTSGTKVKSGELLIRVPADRFGEAMSDLRKLGEVELDSTSAEDVSDQYVDLDARLQAWQSQEAVLLDLMGKATTIEQTIRVQRELQDVQVRIEQIKGQLRVLDDRTAFGTIQVSMREPGGPVVVEQTTSESSRPSLSEAWDKAVDGFVGVFYVVVVGLGYLVPITALAALVWLGYRRTARPRSGAAGTAGAKSA